MNEWMYEWKPEWGNGGHTNTDRQGHKGGEKQEDTDFQLSIISNLQIQI